MTKIKTITVSNLKAVSEMTADFNGCTAVITGGNNRGKTSFLRSLTDRLRGLKTDMVLKQGEREGFYELELTSGEKFIWQFNNKTKAGEKLTYISERNIPGAVTKDICNAYFPPVFDVDRFLNDPPSKQKATLQKLTGIDFTEFDRSYKDAYETRTFHNKQYQIEKAKEEFVDPKLPTEEMPVAALEQQLSAIDLVKERVQNVRKGIDEKLRQIQDNNAEIDRLMLIIEQLGQKNADLSAEIDNGNTWLADEKNQPADADELMRNISAIKEQNEQIRKNNDARHQAERIAKAKKNADSADEEVKRLEAEKLEVIRNSSLPDGFGFSDDGITYNGYEFNKQQLSSSGIYIAALKLAALGLGEVKTLHFDASFLDKNSLQQIEAWANANNLQLLIERPDFEGGQIEYQIIETTESKL